MGIANTITHGKIWVWGTLLAFVGVAAATATLLANTAELRYQRDVNRMVFNDNLGVLEEVKARLGITTDSLNRLVGENSGTPVDQPYIVVSIEERELWFKRGNETLFHTQVATGSGKTLVGKTTSGGQWKFETPRGRLKVQAKEVDPAWVPPDWHFIEQANKRGLGLVRMSRDMTIPSADGSVVKVSGAEVVKRYANGSEVPLEATDGREIVLNGNIIVPPFGTNQRRYKGVLGTRRLVLGDGYALHGTNKPETIGQAVSHGCVRLRNEDIEKLFEMVPVGTTVYIY